MSKKLFHVGDVIRYSGGVTAIMIVEEVSKGHGGTVARYYGEQFFGGSVGAYHGDCQTLSQEEKDNLAAWAADETKFGWRDAKRVSEAIAKMDGLWHCSVYVASSWRCDKQPAVVEKLRNVGHRVYDFRHPAEGDLGFSWREIDANWQTWTPLQYVWALRHPAAERGFKFDMDALRAADAVVMVQPCGRSAALELGWAVGAGKKTCVLLADGQEPELMLKMVDKLCLTLDEVVEWLRGVR